LHLSKNAIQEYEDKKNNNQGVVLDGFQSSSLLKKVAMKFMLKNKKQEDFPVLFVI
jgi:hypothetical protein